jgi:pyridoxal phosphate enzyme (YggS family)
MDARATLVERIAAVRSRIADAARRGGRDPATVTLVAVTKSVSHEMAAVASGLSLDLGENRPQELWRKAAAIPTARWHLIGHLQRNKLDRTVPLVTLIHSVDSKRLLEALDAFGRDRGAPIPILLEINCSREVTKGGFPIEAVPDLSDRLLSLPGIAIRGLMTMAAYSEDPEQSRPAFAELRRQRDDLQMRTGLQLPELSMGMSGDYEIAVEEGATLVRIGTSLFKGLGEG